MNIKAINLALIRGISQFQEDEIESMMGKHLLNSMDALPSGFDGFDIFDDPVGVKPKKHKLFRDAKKGQVVVIGKKKWKIDRNLGVRDSLPRGRGKGGRYLHFVATDYSSSFPGDTLFFYLDVSKDKIHAFKAGSRGGYSRMKVEGIGYTVPSPGQVGGFKPKPPSAFGMKADPISPMDPEKERPEMIKVHLEVMWRGMKPPKREPTWLTSLNGKTERSLLRTDSRKGMFYTKDIRRFEKPSELAKSLDRAEKAVEILRKKAGLKKGYLVKVNIVAQLPKELMGYGGIKNDFRKVRGQNFVTLATWDVWLPRWVPGDRAKDVYEFFEGY